MGNLEKVHISDAVMLWYMEMQSTLISVNSRG